MNVLVTTAHRGVFFGQLEDGADIHAPILSLKSARMAIYWGTTGGVMQLAQTGPTETTRLGTLADIPSLRDITAVFAVTDEAAAKVWS